LLTTRFENSPFTRKRNQEIAGLREGKGVDDFGAFGIYSDHFSWFGVPQLYGAVRTCSCNLWAIGAQSYGLSFFLMSYKDKRRFFGKSIDLLEIGRRQESVVEAVFLFFFDRTMSIQNPTHPVVRRPMVDEGVAFGWEAVVCSFNWILEKLWA
jgi:hypothetical protein